LLQGLTQHPVRHGVGTRAQAGRLRVIGNGLPQAQQGQAGTLSEFASEGVVFCGGGEGVHGWPGILRPLGHKAEGQPQGDTIVPPPSTAFTFAQPMNKLPTRLAALVVALASIAALPAQAQQAPAPAASAPALSPDSLRAEVVTPLMAAQDLARAGNGKDALARIDAAAATPNLTDAERYEILRFRARAMVATDDVAGGLKLYDELLAHPRTRPEELPGLLNGMMGTAYNAKLYPLAITYGERLQKGTNPPANLLFTIASARYLANDFSGAARDMEAFTAAESAAGRVPSEQQFRLLASSHSQAKNDAGYVAALEKLVTHYPKQDFWTDLIARSLRAANLSDRITTQAQVQRLRRAAGTLVDGEDWYDHAEVSLRAGFPAEALRVLEDAQSKNQFTTPALNTKVTQLRTRAQKQASDDEKTLAQAPSGRDMNLLANTGFALATTGQFERGIALMQQAIAAGGLRRPGEVALNLGIAQLWAGQREAAVKSFASVQGSEGEPTLARIWALLKTAQR
jgi:tetratricopeptide (TPR) repeat protein